MSKALKIIAIFLLCWSPFHGLAQEDTSKIDKERMLVIKNDGARYIGYILSDDGREILIETESIGKLYIPKHLIKSISVYDPNAPVIKEEVVHEPKNQPDPIEEKVAEEEAFKYETFTSTKYIQTDNAYPLRKGEAFMKFMPVGFEAQLPLTKNWSIGAISTYIGAPLGLKTKFSFPLKDSSYIGLDLNYGTMAFASIFGVDERNGGGYGSITYTFGSRPRNFSFKLGYAMIHRYWEEWLWDDITGDATIIGSYGVNQFAFGNFGSMLQITERTALVMDFVLAYGEIQAWGENFTTVFASASAAARFGPNPRHKFQLGGTLFVYDGFFVPIPVPNISYTYVFSERNP
jgi:hypothetical protein